MHAVDCWICAMTGMTCSPDPFPFPNIIILIIKIAPTPNYNVLFILLKVEFTYIQLVWWAPCTFFFVMVTNDILSTEFFMCRCDVPLPIHRAKWWEASGAPGMSLKQIVEFPHLTRTICSSSISFSVLYRCMPYTHLPCLWWFMNCICRCFLGKITSYSIHSHFFVLRYLLGANTRRVLSCSLSSISVTDIWCTLGF